MSWLFEESVSWDGTAAAGPTRRVAAQGRRAGDAARAGGATEDESKGAVERVVGTEKGEHTAATEHARGAAGGEPPGTGARAGRGGGKVPTSAARFGAAASIARGEGDDAQAVQPADRSIPSDHPASRRVLGALRARGFGFRDIGPVAGACYAIAALLFAAGVAHLLVFAIRGGPWYGPVSWRKPAEFGTAFGLNLAAATWIATALLPLPARTRSILLVTLAVDSVVEVGGITLQAWRGVPSHVNMQGPLNTGISMMLAVGGGVLIAVLVTMAVAAFRGAPGLAPSMALALRTGFAGLLVGLAAGAGMIARGTTLVRTGHQQEAFHADGFLKPLHAVGLNAIIVLPLLAWLLTFTPWDERRRTRVVASCAAVFGVAALATLVLGLTQL